MKKIKIAYIGGGSRLWARNIMSDLAIDKDLSGLVSLYDIVPEAARNNSIIGNKMMELEDANHAFKFEQSETLKDCLTDADFVFISILPGTFAEMKAYVDMPKKYGIYQPVGDTAGVSGIFRSLIMMPMYEEIALAIKEFSPDAWVINFTNPMSMAVRILYHVFPEIKAFGNCHEVFGTQKLLAGVLKETKGLDVNFRDIDVNPQGINHFTWINKAAYKDIDVFPLYKEFVKKHKEIGYYFADYNKDNVFGGTDKVKLNLFDEYGVIAAAGDRHLVEFFPNELFLGNYNPQPQWGFKLTPVDLRIARMKKDDEDARLIAGGKKEVKITPSNEDAVKQMRALLGLEKFITNVNLPNIGQIENLPVGAIVETNAYFWKDNVQPVFSGKMPLSLVNLTMPHIRTHDLLIKAFQSKNLKFAYEAFIRDVTIKKLTIEDKTSMFKEIYEATKAYMNYYQDLML
jgi:alpha-galactosidase